MGIVGKLGSPKIQRNTILVGHVFTSQDLITFTLPVNTVKVKGTISYNSPQIYCSGWAFTLFVIL